MRADELHVTLDALEAWRDHARAAMPDYCKPWAQYDDPNGGLSTEADYLAAVDDAIDSGTAELEAL